LRLVVKAPTSRTGGMRVGTEHRFERVIRRSFSINSVQLERLSIFLLAHGFVDRALARLCAIDEILVKGTPLTDAEKAKIHRRSISAKIASRIKRARKRGLLSKDAINAAKKINDARNQFMHGKRAFPKFDGKSVLEDDGLYICLSEALKVWLEYARKVKEA